MAETARATATSRLDVLTVDVADLDRHPDLLGDIYRRRYVGALVRGVFEPVRMAQLVERLQAGIEGMPRAVAPTFKGGLYGTPLVMGAEDLRDYLEDAERFRTAVAPLFATAGGLESRIESVLAPIAGGLPVGVARTGDGRAYLPATIRVLVEGDSLPIHYENGTTRAAAMKPILAQLDTETIMSFYLPAALPDGGGVLEVFTTDCSGDGHRIIGDLGGPERARSVLAERGCIEILPGVGDMLLFDGGRHYHLVTEVRGGARWTLGGFFAYTKDRARIVYWS
jgi:hapalindole-type alkaloid chlorinase